MGVFVLGMHRSGTSAVTRAISAFGVPLGHPADAMPPGPDNPEGFAESIALAECNERLLDLAGGRWDAPPELAPGAFNNETAGSNVPEPNPTLDVCVKTTGGHIGQSESGRAHHANFAGTMDELVEVGQSVFEGLVRFGKANGYDRLA